MTSGISIIIPAVDEAAIIQKTICQFKDSKNVEVVVVDGGSKDNTASRAEEVGAIVIPCPIRSRAAQLNLGASKAKHSLLFFVHADVIVPSSYQDDIQKSVRNGYEGGCYRSGYDRYPGLMRINAYLTRFNLLSFRGGDQTLFITKKAFQALGGYNEYYTIMEDYDLLKRMWAAKIPFKLIQKDAVISTRKYDTNSWLRVQIANGVAMFMFKRGRHPEKIKQAYKRMLNYRPENY